MMGFIRWTSVAFQEAAILRVLFGSFDRFRSFIMAIIQKSYLSWCQEILTLRSGVQCDLSVGYFMFAFDVLVVINSPCTSKEFVLKQCSTGIQNAFSMCFDWCMKHHAVSELFSSWCQSSMFGWATWATWLGLRMTLNTKFNDRMLSISQLLAFHHKFQHPCSQTDKGIGQYRSLHFNIIYFKHTLSLNNKGSIWIHSCPFWIEIYMIKRQSFFFINFPFIDFVMKVAGCHLSPYLIV